MFNIGMMELILILLVAFVVVGPKDLPKVAKWIARQIRNIRKLVREVKKETGWDSFAAELRETENDVKKTFHDATDDVTSAVKDVQDTVQDAAKEVRGEVDGLRKNVQDTAKDIRSEQL